MRRSTLALVGVSVLVLAACQATSSETPVVNVNGAGASPTGITVTGTGEVTGTPDTVEVSLGVAVLAENVQDATTTAAQKADALISALTDGGVDRKDITTTDYSIYPEYDYSSNTERLVGYRVSNTVRVKIRNVDDTGSLIDAATAAGGQRCPGQWPPVQHRRRCRNGRGRSGGSLGGRIGQGHPTRIFVWTGTGCGDLDQRDREQHPTTGLLRAGGG